MPISDETRRRAEEALRRAQILLDEQDDEVRSRLDEDDLLPGEVTAVEPDDATSQEVL